MAALLFLPGCALHNQEEVTDSDLPAKAASIRFCLANPTPQADYQTMQDMSGQTVYVSPQAALTRMDVARIRALHSPRRSMLQVVFSPAGAKRLYALTRQHAGAHLAVIIDGELICAPPIHGPVTDGQLHIVGDFSRKQAEELAAAVNRQQAP
ncbi:MAG: hypothetical protein ABIG44_12380 [Planctomycetota bacterium]